MNDGGLERDIQGRDEVGAEKRDIILVCTCYQMDILLPK